MKTLDLCDQNISDVAPDQYDQIKIGDCTMSELFEPDSGFLKIETWTQIWAYLKPHGVLLVGQILKLIGKSKILQDFSQIVRQLNSIFMLVGIEDDSDGKQLFVFAKVTNPEIVTTEVLNDLIEAGKPLNSLFQHIRTSQEICTRVKFEEAHMKQLGRGAEGVVYYDPTWRTEAVIKMVANIGRYVPGDSKQLIKDPVKSTYHPGKFLEVLSSSLLTGLTTGNDKHGFTFHVQRFTGFFTCIEKEQYDLYLISEKMDDTFADWVLRDRPVKTFKALVWQALYITISLNRLGWQHHDANCNNFLIKEIEQGDYFMSEDIGSAKEWIYKLDGLEWSLQNVGAVLKIADYGFTTHFEYPVILGEDMDSNLEKVDYRVNNKMKGNADVNYFMTTLTGRLGKPSLIKLFTPLYEEWCALIKAPKMLDPIREFRRFNWEKPEGPVQDMMTSKYRLIEKYDQWDAMKLLNSKFFDDVMKIMK
jgi:hypothetical protein